MDCRDDKLIIFLVRLLKIKIASHFCALHLEVQILDYVFVTSGKLLTLPAHKTLPANIDLEEEPSSHAVVKSFPLGFSFALIFLFLKILIV